MNVVNERIIMYYYLQKLNYWYHRKILNQSVSVMIYKETDLQQIYASYVT